MTDGETVLEAALNDRADAIATHNARGFAPARALGIEIAAPGEILGRLIQ